MTAAPNKPTFPSSSVKDITSLSAGRGCAGVGFFGAAVSRPPADATGLVRRC